MMPIRWLRERVLVTMLQVLGLERNGRILGGRFNHSNSLTVMMAFLAAGGLEAVKPESLQTSKPVQPLEL